MSRTRSTTTSIDGPAADATITVRLTDSIADTSPPLAALHDLDATVEFESLTRAYTFGERLNRRDDTHTYQLAPDHDGDATLYLYREEQRE